MAAKDCIDAIKKAAGEDITDDQLDDVLTLLDRRAARRMKDDPLLSRERAYAEAGAELAEEKKLAALIEKRNRGINVLRKQQRTDFYDSAGTDQATSISALMVGREGSFSGAGRSIDAVRHGLTAELVGPMVNDLRQAGLLEVARTGNPEYELAVAREMARLNGNDSIKQSGDRNVTTMAQILVKYGEAGRQMQNEAGAYIRKMPGYVTRQSHDQLKIAKAGFENWQARIEPLLDPRTFDDAADKTKFLRSVYNNLATGNHLKAGGASDWLGGFKGPGNLAKRASSERVLIFKGPDEWMAYNTAFGRSSLWEAVIDGLEYSARNTALMRAFGTNPEAAFRADVDQAILKAKDAGDLKTVEKLSGWRIRAEFDQVAGATQVRGTPSLAVWGAGTRAVISMAKLGGVVLSSIPDVAVRASVLRHNGVGLLDGYANALTTFMEGRKGSEKREIADLLNVGTQGILGGVFERFHATDNVPGRMSKLTNVFFQATGLTFWTDAMSRGVGLMLSRNLANQSTKAFGQLDPRLQTTLRRYGIGEEAWGLLTKADTKAADGEHFLTPDAVRLLPDADIAAYAGKDSPRAIADARRELETSLSTYFADQVREAMTVAGARERALVTFGQPAGTPLGEAIRFVTQFKTYPVTFLTKQFGREISRDGVDKAGLAHLMVATTVLGYAAMTAKELVKGRDIRRPEDAGDVAKLFAAAMQQGGGLGIYGDFLFGEYNRFGRGLAETLAGPAVGTAGEWAAVLSAAVRGDDARAKAVRATVNTTPFANLFYARTAMDYLFLYGVQESLNPGYLRRYERTVEKENNQQFIYPPSQYANRF